MGFVMRLTTTTLLNSCFKVNFSLSQLLGVKSEFGLKVAQKNPAKSGIKF